MTVLATEAFSRKSPDRQVAAFVTSVEFMSLCHVVAKAFPGNLAASFLNTATYDDLMLTWVRGELGSSVGFTMVQEEMVKKIDQEYRLRPGTIYPELQLTDEMGNPTNRKIEQLVIQSGRSELSAFTIPADVVVDGSGMSLSFGLQYLTYHNISNPEVKARFGLRVRDDGAITAYEARKLNKSATAVLDSALGKNNDFLRAVGNIS